MKKFMALVLSGMMMVTVVGCSSQTATPETTTQSEAAGAGVEEETQEESVPVEETTITLSVSNADGEYIDVEFPKDPQRVVVLNLQTLDFLDAVGLGDRVVGLIKETTMPEHLQKYVEDENIANVGGMKDVDMEAVMSLQPDVIFSSDRTRSMYEEFSMIAPTMSSYVAYADGFFDSFKALANRHGQLFGLEDELNDIIAGYEERIAAINTFAEGKSAILGIFAGGLNTLGNDGRASLIVNEMGFENLVGDIDVNHGNISSYELLLDLDPEYMFILDKDTAVGAEAVVAREQMENPIVAQTQAYQNGNIIYLEPGAVWYLADGGITSMDLMISNIEEGIGLK